MSNVWHACGIGVKRIVWHWCGMARQDLHFRLRLPEELKAKIEAAAEAERRSMTAEIVQRLEQSFSGMAITLPSDIRVRVEEAARRSHRQFADEFLHALDYLYPASSGEPPPVPTLQDVSDFEREFVESQHQLLMTLMRKHGMNPIDSRDLLAADEHPAPSDEPFQKAPPAGRPRRGNRSSSGGDK